MDGPTKTAQRSGPPNVEAGGRAWGREARPEQSGLASGAAGGGRPAPESGAKQGRESAGQTYAPCALQVGSERWRW